MPLAITRHECNLMGIEPTTEPCASPAEGTGFEAALAHPLVQCLRGPSNGQLRMYQGDGSRLTEFMHACHTSNASMKIFKLALVESLYLDWDKGGFVVSPERVSASGAVCVPEACSLFAVGSWLIPMFLRQLIRRPANLAALRMTRSCRRGQVVLPPRSAFKALLRTKIFGGTFHWNTAYADGLGFSPWTAEHLFLVISDVFGDSRVLVTEQKMPKQVASEPPSIGQGAALVLAGQWRFRRRSVLALRRFVAEPLQAKVFAAVSRFGPENISAQAARAALHEVFGAELAAFSFLRDPPGTGVLHAELHPDAVDVHHTGGGHTGLGQELF
ncbi:unnamed protein product [Symbiodinium sp. CCMP2592]|nr:unnamed protein product [Symbiodinium sp. CCMP2592]